MADENNAHWQAERRDKMESDGLRTLLLLNGGGAVALLAFLQAVWKEPSATDFIPWVLGGMIFLVFGAAAGGYVHFLRADASTAFQMKGQDGKAAKRRYRCIANLAFGLFLVGIAVVIVGAFRNMPSKDIVSITPPSHAAASSR